MDGKELKKLRKKLKYNLRNFSEKVNISRAMLSKYERGISEISEEKEQQIRRAVGLVNQSSYQLHVHFDYIKLTFFESTIGVILDDVLGIPLEYFVVEDSRKNNYETKYSCGHIVVFDRTSDDSQGILLDLTGQGVFEFEQHLESMDMTFREWFRKILSPEWYVPRGYYSRTHSTRIDIAIDEMYDPINGNFNLYELKKRRDKNLVSTDFKVYREQEKKFNEEHGGLTLYYGARGGDSLFVRFYEKRHELADKLKISVEESLEEHGIWNRYELEIGKKYNEQVLEDYLNGIELDEIAINLLLSKFEVYDEVDGQRTFYEEFYQIFGSWKTVKINGKREESSLEKSMRWIELQVVPTLKLIELILGKDRFRRWLFDAMERAELTDKKEKQVKYERMMERKGLNE